jgi:non-specific serine/threonine protein kinase
MAVEMAVAMRPVWMLHGMLGEARRWLELVLEATSGQPSLPRIHALCDIAMITFLQGELAAVCAAVAEAREHLAMMPDTELSARFDAMEGYVAVQTGEVEQAAQCLRRALAGATDFEPRFAAMYYLGWVHEVSGDLDEAMSCFETALDLTRSHGESMYQSRALVSVGMGHWLREEHDRAGRALIEGLCLSQLVGEPLVGAQCLETLAWIASSRDDWRHAAVMMAAANALSRAIGAPLLRLPDLIACHRECDTRTRQELGTERFEAAWAEGDALNFDEAVALALDACKDWGMAVAPRREWGLVCPPSM